MLYECWCRVARANPDQIALFDPVLERQWTFGELFSCSESRPNPADSILFPRGTGSDFILGVLDAWRCAKAVCPLEPGQNPPEFAGKVPGSIVHLKTTSATAGKPRLVIFTEAQLMADARNIVSTMGLRPEWPNLAVISLAHSYGFSNLVLPLLLYGVPLILIGSALPEAVRHAAESHRSVTLAAVPALWQTWHAAAAIPSNVKLAISAGAPLPLALEGAVFANSGLKIHNFYGSSECGGIAYDATEVPRTDSTCVGSALHNVELSIGRDGCVEVRSAAVGETYWPESGPELGQGIFRTSDVGYLSGKMLHLNGRAGDQINVAGRKVLPETIEAVLTSHPEVRACLAFGVPSPDAQRGEAIVACVAGRISGMG